MRPTAVVLAAGSGRRLQPLTDKEPKCLLEVAGRPILGRLLDAVADAGVRRAVVVTGHLSRQVEEYIGALNHPLDVLVARNHAYATTNNAASLLAARAAIGTDGLLLCDGDVVFSSSPFPALLASAHPCVLAVDCMAALDAEEMKVQLDAGGLVKRISKALDPRAAAGESIGVQRISGDAVPMLWRALEELLPGRAADAYYEDAFQMLIDRGVPFGICPVESASWMEIDDLADLTAARHRFVAS
jgi:choline kinase